MEKGLFKTSRIKAATARVSLHQVDSVTSKNDLIPTTGIREAKEKQVQ